MEIIISHCYREMNQVANLLANLGTKNTASLAILEPPPREILDTLYADKIGVLHQIILFKVNF